MRLFDFFKKKKEPVQKKSAVLLAMPMFNSGESFDAKKLQNHLKEYWNVNISDIESDNNTITFMINGELVAVAAMPVQIPFDDIEATAQYAYNWPKAVEDLKFHDCHSIVTVISNNTNQTNRFTILTMLLDSILQTTNSIGIYNGTQSLLLPKKQFIESASVLKDNLLPIDLWIYIGLRNTPTGQNGYTYGLKEFGKLEMEIIDSQISLEEIYDLLLNICSYLIKSNVTFQSGQTLGFTAEQKIKITKSQGIFTEGQIFKLGM